MTNLIYAKEKYVLGLFYINIQHSQLTQAHEIYIIKNIFLLLSNEGYKTLLIRTYKHGSRYQMQRATLKFGRSVNATVRAKCSHIKVSTMGNHKTFFLFCRRVED